MLVETMDEIPLSTDLHGRWTYLSRHWTKVFEKDPYASRSAHARSRLYRRRGETALLRAVSSLLAGDVEEVHFEFQANVAADAPIHLRAREVAAQARWKPGRLWRHHHRRQPRNAEPAGARRERAAPDLTRQRMRRSVSSMSTMKAMQFSQQRMGADARHVDRGRAGHGLAARASTRIRRRVTRHLQTNDKQALPPMSRWSCRRHRRHWNAARGLVTTALRNGDGEITGRMGVVVDQTREHKRRWL